MVEHTDDREPAAAEVLSSAELAQVPVPEGFTLVGFGAPHAIDDGYGRVPLVVDGEGMILPNGTALLHCLVGGCCDPALHQWRTVDEAADYHGALIVRQSDVRLPDA